jgi:hypothetical protein
MCVHVECIVCYVCIHVHMYIYMHAVCMENACMYVCRVCIDCMYFACIMYKLVCHGIVHYNHICLTKKKKKILRYCSQRTWNSLYRNKTFESPEFFLFLSSINAVSFSCNNKIDSFITKSEFFSGSIVMKTHISTLSVFLQFKFFLKNKVTSIE